MRFPIQDTSKLDPAALADELTKALGSHYNISTAGGEITTNGQVEPDPVAFQAVLNAHIANAPARAFNKEAKRLEAVVQKLVDTTAQRKGYDNAVSCASYANSTNAAYKADAAALIAWRDAVWASCNSQLATAQTSGVIPTDAQVLALLPAFTAW